LRFSDIEVEAFIHATESAEAVERALRTIAPEARVERTQLGGHFGQNLAALRGRLKEPKQVEAAVERLRAEVGPQLARQAHRRVDPSLRLHARFDKQAAALGQVVLSTRKENDVIKFSVRLKAGGQNREEALAVFRRLFAPPGLLEEE
jgi:RNA binding exosome subunit